MSGCISVHPTYQGTGFLLSFIISPELSILLHILKRGSLIAICVVMGLKFSGSPAVEQELLSDQLNERINKRLLVPLEELACQSSKFKLGGSFLQL